MAFECTNGIMNFSLLWLTIIQDYWVISSYSSRWTSWTCTLILASVCNKLWVHCRIMSFCIILTFYWFLEEAGRTCKKNQLKSQVRCTKHDLRSSFQNVLRNLCWRNPTKIGFFKDLPNFFEKLIMIFHCVQRCLNLPPCEKTCPILPGCYFSFFTVGCYAHNVDTVRKPVYSCQAANYHCSLCVVMPEIVNLWKNLRGVSRNFSFRNIVLLTELNYVWFHISIYIFHLSLFFFCHSLVSFQSSFKVSFDIWH